MDNHKPEAEQIIELLAEYSTRLDLKILDGQRPTDAVMPKFLALIAQATEAGRREELQALKDRINIHIGFSTWEATRIVEDINARLAVLTPPTATGEEEK